MDDYAEQNGMVKDSTMEEPAPALPPWSPPITELDLSSHNVRDLVQRLSL